tara:strand:+ start:7336 stop:7887 length:552 start_codon:yes stop_codon:yes gene_type:complete
MAITYTNQYNPNINYGSAQLDATTSQIANPGLMGGRLRYKCSSFTLAGSSGAADQVRLFAMKSSDIIVSLTVTCPAYGGTDEADFGFYYSNEGGLVQGPTGSISTVASIANDVELAGADTGTQVLYHTDTTRAQTGFTNWERMNAGAATYTVDPCETWELTLTFVGVASGAPLTAVEMTYVAT